jgi:7,8-dihydropterin-6-yl-methyl-4-(beta-D-ribofuranosyl)aminobenzene 5'-phosphate synthase
MKLQVLADNHTDIDEYLLGEPALSFYIEDNGAKILFDTGYSDVFLRNAEKRNIDLKTIDTLILSHGHNDHTGGLRHLRFYTDLKKVRTVAHPLCFCRKTCHGEDCGAPFRTEQMAEICDLELSVAPLQISENIVFLGEIPITNDYEKREEMGLFYESDGTPKEDFLRDDTALAYRHKDGIFIITGCSHSGICNIIEYAKSVCKTERVLGIIGGFHLFEVNGRLEKTLSYFQKNEISLLYPCHCISFQVKAKINEKIPIYEVGVGQKIIL